MVTSLSPWSEGDYPPLGSRGLVARGDWAMRTFSDLGAPPPPGSRLPAAVSLIRDLNNESVQVDVTDSRLLTRISSAQKTVWNLFIIAYSAAQIRKSSQPVFPSDLMAIALGGAEIDEQDKNSKARDTEFELYVASMLHLGGATVRIAEPDIELLLPGGCAGVACKRLTSTAGSKLASRMSKAASQIERCHGMGYVAVNIDSYYRGEALSASSEERIGQFDARMQRVIQAAGNSFAGRPAVKGVIAFGHLSAWDSSVTPPSHFTAYPTSVQLIVDEDDEPARMAAINAFWERLIRNMRVEVRSLISSDDA